MTSVPAALAPPVLRAAYALHFADEALSSVRHDVLNRLTALGAITYELRSRQAEAADLNGRGHGERIADLNRQIALISQTVSRRLGSPRESGARTSLSLALQSAVAACPQPGLVRIGQAADRVVRGSTSDVAVILLALLDNACQAGAVTVDVRWSLEEDEVRIQVIDDGAGLSGEARERALDRFFTTRPGHAGLGASLARTLAIRLGGELQLRAGPERGTRATLTLPSADGEDDGDDAGGEGDPGAREGGR